jgi:hypothetical protein
MRHALPVLAAALLLAALWAPPEPPEPLASDLLPIAAAPVPRISTPTSGRSPESVPTASWVEPRLDLLHVRWTELERDEHGRRMLVEGYVVDRATGTLIAGAEVSGLGHWGEWHGHGVSDAGGAFAILLSGESIIGEGRLRISAEGFKDVIFRPLD